MKRKTEVDEALIRGLTRWFRASARDLPWRASGPPGRRDAYHVLVSEVMLQQTQVSRVAERFGEFMARFPDVAALAGAEEDEVLAVWSGLGYYRRARLLHAAARAVVAEHGGRLPREVRTLRALPGLGRYTAGAVASLAHGEGAALVDANVARVLMRLGGRRGTAAVGMEWAWERAEALAARAGERAPVVNEAMMELGATVCTPRGPRCEQCPVRDLCIARAKGWQERIPAPKVKAAKKEVFASAVVVRVGDRIVVEQRPEKGLWARMWQVPTLEREDRAATREEIEEWLGVKGLKKVDAFVHETTHRTVRFEVWEAVSQRKLWNGREVVAPASTSERAISTPQRRIVVKDCSV